MGRLVVAQEPLVGNQAVVVGVLILGLEDHREFQEFRSAVDQDPASGKTLDQVHRLVSALVRLVKTQGQLRLVFDHLLALFLAVFECHSCTDPLVAVAVASALALVSVIVAVKKP